MSYSKNAILLAETIAYHFELLDSSPEASFLLMPVYQDLWLFPCEVVSAKSQYSIQKNLEREYPTLFGSQKVKNTETPTLNI